jgi:hypothetical protein
MTGQLSMQSGDLSIPFYGSPVIVVNMPPDADSTYRRAIAASNRVSIWFQNGSIKNHQLNNPLVNQLKFLFAGVLTLALASAAHAQTTDGSMLYTPNVDLTTLSQNSFVGTVGGIFLTTYSYYPEVNYLGYADPTGAPLQDSHLVSLWDNSTGNIIASATVAAGNAAPLIDGYRWVQLSSTVTLNYGSYYVIGAQTDGVDLWGDLISNNSPDNGSNGQVNWNPEYVQLGSGWEFTRGGRYDSASNYPTEPSNQTSVQDSIYPVANLGFDLAPVPEPGTFGILGIGAAMLFGSAFLRKNFSKSVKQSRLET